MKKSLPSILAWSTCIFFSVSAQSQTSLVPDQNPDFAVSRDKYMKVADSINSWHSTTVQETYEASDWMADRLASKAARRVFRRQLSLERARWYDNDSYGNYYYQPNRYRRGNYRGNYYNNRNYHRRNRPLISLGFWCW
ncbi:MAG: hypothetical protein H7Y42_11895 [Chitinophagaceae bacterium]|nr:hypothetical protein [Chitinophagaceae bacterium]